MKVGTVRRAKVREDHSRRVAVAAGRTHGGQGVTYKCYSVTHGSASYV